MVNIKHIDINGNIFANILFITSNAKKSFYKEISNTLKLSTKWRKTAQSLLRRSLIKPGPNARLRERLLALHFVASDEPTDKKIDENFKIKNLTSFTILSHRILDYLMPRAFKKV